jgi:hypothetical protein
LLQKFPAASSSFFSGQKLKKTDFDGSEVDVGGRREMKEGGKKLTNT